MNQSSRHVNTTAANQRNICWCGSSGILDHSWIAPAKLLFCAVVCMMWPYFHIHVATSQTAFLPGVKWLTFKPSSVQICNSVLHKQRVHRHLNAPDVRICWCSPTPSPQIWKQLCSSLSTWRFAPSPHLAPLKHCRIKPLPICLCNIHSSLYHWCEEYVKWLSRYHRHEAI